MSVNLPNKTLLCIFFKTFRVSRSCWLLKCHVWFSSAWNFFGYLYWYMHYPTNAWFYWKASTVVNIKYSFAHKKNYSHVGLNSVNKVRVLYIETSRIFKKITTMDCQFPLCDGDLFTVACHPCVSATCCRVYTLTLFTVFIHNRVTLLCKSGGNRGALKRDCGCEKNVKI